MYLFRRYKSINYIRDFKDYESVFKGWRFSCKDFEDLKLEPTDFVYADPPYDVEFTKYSKEDFTWEDQEKLALWLKKHPGPVVLSNSSSTVNPRYRPISFVKSQVDGFCTPKRCKM